MINDVCSLCCDSPQKRARVLQAIIDNVRMELWLSCMRAFKTSNLALYQCSRVASTGAHLEWHCGLVEAVGLLLISPRISDHIQAILHLQTQIMTLMISYPFASFWTLFSGAASASFLNEVIRSNYQGPQDHWIPIVIKLHKISSSSHLIPLFLHP